eukprot:3458861-Rhodomonas_salina.3
MNVWRFHKARLCPFAKCGADVREDGAQALIEKICVLLVLDVCKQEASPPIVGDKFAEYADALVSQVRIAFDRCTSVLACS